MVRKLTGDEPALALSVALNMFLVISAESLIPYLFVRLLIAGFIGGGMFLVLFKE